MLTQTTHRYMGLVFRQTLTCYRNACPSALMRCRCGWLLTGCCSTLPRLRCCSVLWCSSARRKHQLPTGSVRIGNTLVVPVSMVRDLGVYIDADHLTASVRACFTALQQIRSVQRSLTRDALLTLLRALVITNVDYCSSTLAGVSGALLQRLQSVLNAAARLLFSARRSEHITPLLRELHWFKVPECIQFVCLCVLMHRCLHGTAPSYLAETLQLMAEVQGRRRLRSA